MTIDAYQIPMPALLRPTEAARLLNTTENRLAKMRLTGIGPEYVKMGKSVYYRPEALDAFLRDCTRRSTTDMIAA